MKDVLGQHTMLVTEDEGSFAALLVRRYLEMARKEMENVVVTHDTHEADLKQRRELVEGRSIFVDEAVVRAALHGRTLVLEGIERAEQAVLPLLNSLLESQEMQLEDGRFMMSPKRYDLLLKSGSSEASLAALGVVRVSERFRCIFVGNGERLDPPVRSRLQGRLVGRPTLREVFASLARVYDESVVEKVAKAYSAVDGATQVRLFFSGGGGAFI